MCSLVIRPADLGLIERQWPQASLTTGLSVCLALEDIAPSEEVALKWPNDVFLNRRKICGVLVEVGPKPSQTLVIGIGVNVNNSFREAPRELRHIATSLSDATGNRFALTDVLIRILRQVELQFLRLSREDPDLADDWQQRCALQGRTIDLETGSQTITGVCQGIDDDGALVLLTDGGPERFFGGVIVCVR